MVNVDMQHTLCKSALFQRTRMCGADFSFADLTSARMQRCDLRDAVLTDVRARVRARVCVCSCVCVCGGGVYFGERGRGCPLVSGCELFRSC